MGKWIVVGGLIIQIFFFGYFMVVSGIFFLRLSKNPTRRSESKDIPWRLHMLVLFTASILIFTRSVFRVIEYVQGPNGYLLSHEVWLYIFDASIIAVVVLLFNIVHPSQITALLRGRSAVYQVLKVEEKAKLCGLDDEEEQAGKQMDMAHLMQNARTEYTSIRA